MLAKYYSSVRLAFIPNLLKFVLIFCHVYPLLYLETPRKLETKDTPYLPHRTPRGPALVQVMFPGLSAFHGLTMA